MNALCSQVVVFPLLPFLSFTDLITLSSLNKGFYGYYSRVILSPPNSFFPYSTELVAGEWIFTSKNQPDPLVCLDTSGKKNHAKLEGAVYHKSGKGVFIDNTETPSHSRVVQRRLVSVHKNLDSFDPQHGCGFTVEAWISINPHNIKPREFQNPIVSKHGWATGYELRVNHWIPTFVISVNGKHEEVGDDYHLGRSFEKFKVEKAPYFQQDKYYHIAGTFTYPSGRLAVYKNGVLAAERGISIRRGINFHHFPGDLTFGVSSDWKDRSTSLNLIAVRITHIALKPEAFMPFPK